MTPTSYKHTGRNSQQGLVEYIFPRSYQMKYLEFFFFFNFYSFKDPSDVAAASSVTEKENG